MNLLLNLIAKLKICWKFFDEITLTKDDRFLRSCLVVFGIDALNVDRKRITTSVFVECKYQTELLPLPLRYFKKTRICI